MGAPVDVKTMAVTELTYKSFWLVWSCGCAFLELASGVPIILSCNRRPPFLKLSDAFLVVELSLLVIVGDQYGVILQRKSTSYARKAGPSLRTRYKHIEGDGLYAGQACQSLLRESGRRKGPLSVSIRRLAED